jgi:hypothetical protein
MNENRISEAFDAMDIDESPPEAQEEAERDNKPSLVSGFNAELPQFSA